MSVPQWDRGELIGQAEPTDKSCCGLLIRLTNLGGGDFDANCCIQCGRFTRTQRRNHVCPHVRLVKLGSYGRVGTDILSVFQWNSKHGGGYGLCLCRSGHRTMGSLGDELGCNLHFDSWGFVRADPSPSHFTLLSCEYSPLIPSTHTTVLRRTRLFSGNSTSRRWYQN